MLFIRIIWSSLAVALVVGSVQTGMQRLQAAPLILAAEVFEVQKTQTPSPSPAPMPMPALAAPVQGVAADAHEHEHEHGTAKEWEPSNGAERMAWTWVANSLHALSMALLVFAVMGAWRYLRGSALSALTLAGAVAGAGWLSFYLWPALGLPAQLPGMDAAPLQARQVWSVLAVASAVAACALAGFGRAQWRWPVAAILLALPFVVGAPQLGGDALVGFSPAAQTALAQLLAQFFWATTWVSLSFWLTMGLACAWVFKRYLQSELLATF
jgi:cobalt transporter subunit CbtA